MHPYCINNTIQKYSFQVCNIHQSQKFITMQNKTIQQASMYDTIIEYIHFIDISVVDTVFAKCHLYKSK